MEELSQKHRFTSIQEIKDKLNKEITTCTSTLKKYQKAYNVINTISITSGTLAGGSAIITTSSISNPIISLPTACISAILGSITLVTGVWNKILLKKIEKYEQYLSIGQSKLNSIEIKLSQSTDDNTISAEEFLTCMNIYESYNKMKQDIRIKYKLKNLNMKKTKKSKQ